MVLTAAELCSALSPHHPAVRVQQLSWSRVMGALVANNLVLPVCALLTLCYRRIEWGGVVYTRNLCGAPPLTPWRERERERAADSDSQCPRSEPHTGRVRVLHRKSL
jgi:hypothetical protein